MERLNETGGELVKGQNLEQKTLLINGRKEQTSAKTVEELVAQLGQQNKKLVIELNGVIVQRALWAETELQDGDSIELVHFVGGG
nr:sulfur carrier protein ThiS [Paenibacillus sp. PL91]